MYLGIDTATPFLALALWSDGEVARYERELGREHGSHIMAALSGLFAAADCQPSDIQGIGVGLGPGSYTGVRVGIATALGLARGWTCPVVGVSTLQALAVGYLEQHPKVQQVTAAIDARRGNVYAATFTINTHDDHDDYDDHDDHDDYAVTERTRADNLYLQSDIQKMPRTELTGHIAEGIAPSAWYVARYACEHKDDGGKLEPYYL